MTNSATPDRPSLSQNLDLIINLLLQANNTAENNIRMTTDSGWGLYGECGQDCEAPDSRRPSALELSETIIRLAQTNLSLQGQLNSNL